MAHRSALINVMITAAQKASRKLLRDFGEVEHLQVSRKGPADFVSTADKTAEKTLRNIVSGKDIETEYDSFSQKDVYDGSDLYIRLIGMNDTDPTQKILTKIQLNNELLGSLCNINQGVVTGANFLTLKNKSKHNY